MQFLSQIKIIGIYYIQNNEMDMVIFGNKNSIKFLIQIIDYKIMQHRFLFLLFMFINKSIILDLVIIIFSFYFNKN